MPRQPTTHANAPGPGRRERTTMRGSKRPARPPTWIPKLVRACVRLTVVGGLAYGLLIGVQHGYDYATTSPRFEVRGLTYVPTPHVDDARLRELMALTPGTNILALHLDEIAERIAKDPWVFRATVTRVLPDSLSVEVVEHEPQAVLAAGDFYLIGAQGLPFKPLEAGERGRLPIITGIGRDELLAHPERARARIARALRVLESYAEKRRPRLSEIHIDETDAVTLYTAELGTQLRLGRGDVESSLARYDALRAALGEQAETLAVAHLDSAGGPTPVESGRTDRVVASFFPTKDVPTLVASAGVEAAAKAVAHDARAQAEAAKDARHDDVVRKQGRIPHYE
jgi:cell division protein FtsQ